MSLLNVKFLKQLDCLQIRSHEIFRGKSKGERRSLNRGVGIEFVDYRPYELGDDLRHVDWNVYARLNLPFIKLFSADEDLSIFIFIDNSKSMSFGTPAKLECAKRIAAALGYIGLANFDRVSIITLSDQMIPIVPLTYGKSQFPKVSRAIEAIAAAQETHLGTCLTHFCASRSQTGVAIVVSDFLDRDGYELGLKQLIARKFDLTVIQLLSDEELHPKLSGELRLEDAETGKKKEITVSDQTLANYSERVNTFCDRLKGFCLNQGITNIQINNRVQIEELIFQSLRKVGLIL
jgi:uncharacterized protein (DUF58 family)